MKIKDSKELKRRLKEGYSICFDCASDNGAKTNPPMAVTCWSGKCCICEEEKSCCAVSDWVWPKEIKVKHVFD